MSTEIYQRITEITSSGDSCVLVTVVETSGSGPMSVGKKMLIESSGSSVGTVGGGALEYQAIETAKQIFAQRTSRMEAYLLDGGASREGHTTIPMICGGSVRLFFEFLSGGEPVYIFGGGHVGRALARQLELVGFYTRIIEDRDDVFAEITEGRQRIHESFHSYASRADIDENSFVVVCTPSHENDYDVIRALTDRGIKPRYVGMLASPAKKADFVSRMRAEYGADVDLSFVYSPIGLDIGGPSPAEIALGTAAEMIAVKYRKTGLAHMRDGEGDGPK